VGVLSEGDVLGSASEPRRDADPNLAEGGTAFDYTPLYIAARDGRDEIALLDDALGEMLE